MSAKGDAPSGEWRLVATNDKAGPMPRARRWAPETCFRVPPCAARRSPAL